MANIRLLCVLAALSITAHAQMKMTADQVVSFIKSSIQLKHDDRKVAEYVHKIKLSDKLEDRRVEELQGLGAGPKTVAALRELSAASSTLTVTPPAPPPPPKPVIPPPNSIEQKAILAEIIEGARNYSKSLPNYLCVQVTRRHFDPSGSENWRLYDVVQEQLSYVDHHESYKVAMINGKAVANIDHHQLGGSTLSGDFGSIYTEIFAAETDAEFEWDHWATLRGRRMYVFSYHVPQSRSHFTISDETHRVITAGYHGLIYADRDTKMVMRYKMECEGIPADFSVRDVKLDVNYDFIKIAEQEYVLPLKTDLKSVANTPRGKYMSWNEAEFHLYRRFGTETNIIFDTPPDPIPDEKIKEEPALPDTKKEPPPVKKKP
jgi:hypothetical protein